MKWTYFRKYFKKQTRRENAIYYEQVKDILKKDPSALLLDIRSRQEYKEGSLAGAQNLPSSEIKRQIGKGILEKKERTIIIFCASGTRSKKVAQLLEKNGYQEVYELKEGLENI